MCFFLSPSLKKTSPEKGNIWSLLSVWRFGISMSKKLFFFFLFPPSSPKKKKKKEDHDFEDNEDDEEEIKVKESESFFEYIREHSSNRCISSLCFGWVIGWVWCLENDLPLIVWTIVGTYWLNDAWKHCQLQVHLMTVVAFTVLLLSYLLLSVSVLMFLTKCCRQMQSTLSVGSGKRCIYFCALSLFVPFFFFFFF
ncbi:hypothetical protein RFI_12482 [Reticulomyxa filosa]|uniref:Uncharacterized protein n=1 Tax=Reticulomyxa filosa TaxID=46433 RepID=X6NFY3_RETFI|nr:hypothetical protein RFI_12482 [Reticulomyxa filosa]|eukprot:ETO24674.1 hypothetical protein RFI_12482 [Reticulomyxa filosa]